MFNMKNDPGRLLCFGLLLLALAAGPAAMADEREDATNTVLPEGGENTCDNCHAKELEAWKQTAHYATYKNRHSSERAKEIMGALGIRSMRSSDQCRQCHYTSVIVADKVRAKAGVSCESCHSPGMKWNNIHNKAGGDPAGQTLKWGAGKSESAEAKASRLGKAQEAGMISSSMTYEIAANCFGCHTVPNEQMVNKGGHKSGSDFDLVAWSQGEIRHNFATSAGAPNSPTNRETTPEQKRRLYVVGAMVDLEVTLRNLAGVKEPGEAFHTAMVARANRARVKADKILGAIDAPGLSAALGALPSKFDASTSIDASMAGKLEAATRAFADKTINLAAIDGQLPKEFKGESLP